MEAQREAASLQEENGLLNEQLDAKMGAVKMVRVVAAGFHEWLVGC